MIFFKMFYVFSKIGIFNFGGGYAMLSLIQNETVVKNHWLTNAEFTDIVAISQSTPGPIGINAATYVGYTAVVNAGYPHWAAVCSAVMCSLAIMWLSFILMICVSRYLLAHKDSREVKDVFKALRPTIVGLIAAAALLLMTKDNFGSPADNPCLFGLSIVLFAAAFYFTKVQKDQSHPRDARLRNSRPAILLNWGREEACRRRTVLRLRPAGTIPDSALTVWKGMTETASIPVHLASSID